METEELLGHAKAGALTEEALTFVLEELKARGVHISELQIQSSSLPTNDKSAEHEAWKQTRKKGKWPFVFWRGVVFWGLPMFVIQTFVITGPPTPASWFYSETSKYSFSWLAFMLVFGCLAGSLVALFNWNRNERAFKKEL